MAKDTFKMVRVDLSEERDGFAVPVDRARRIVVWTGDADALLRVDAPGGDTIPAKEGGELCDPAGISTVFVDHPGGGGTLELLTVHGDALAELGSGVAGRGLPAAERLSGDLAAGTTISSGSEASEDVDLTGTERLLAVIARVSGIDSFTDSGAFSDTDLANVADVAAGEGDGTFYAVTSDGTVVALDVSDPGSVSNLGSLNEPTASQFHAAEYDPVSDKVVAIGDGGGNALLYIFDVSDPTAISLDGSLDLGVAPDGSGFEINLDLAASASAAWCGVNYDLLIVEYTTPSGPTLETSFADLGSAVGLDEDAGVAVTMDDPGDRVATWSFSDPLAPSLEFLGQLVRPDGTTVSPLEGRGGTVVDGDRGFAGYLDRGGSDGTGLLDISDISAPTVVDFVTSGGGTPRYIVIDREGGFLITLEPDGFLAQAVFFGYTSGVLNEGIQGSGLVGNTLAWDGGLEVGIVGEDGDDSVHPFELNPGNDRLLVQPLLADGATPTNIGAASTKRLRNEVEVLSEVDVKGQDTARVTVRAQSGQDATVDFVDVFRR